MSEFRIDEGRVAHWDRKRRRIILQVAIAYGVWMASSLVPDQKFNNVASLLLLVLNLLSWAVWCFGLIQMHRWGKEVLKEPAVVQALCDERWEHNRLKAVVTAFVAVMLVQVGLVLWGLSFRLDAKIGAQISILVGVTGFLLAMLYFDRE